MTCRDEILKCIHQITSGQPDVEFDADEVLRCMRGKGSAYAESTIRTHIASRMCGNAPKQKRPHRPPRPGFARPQTREKSYSTH